MPRPYSEAWPAHDRLRGRDLESAMLTRIALGFLMLLPALPVANAASFDCAKASTAFERAICEFPELSKRDEILAKAYATALGGLSEAAEATVQKGQREWLAFAERACASEITGSY